MTNSIHLYARYIAAAFRGSMQYRISIFLFSVGLFVLCCVEFFAMWALFDRFGALRSWTLAEVAICYGMSSCSFALAGMIIRGFDTFDGMVRSGSFDRILLRPRTTVLQILGQGWFLVRLGRLAQAVPLLFWSAWTIDTHWTLPLVLLIMASIVAGSCVFGGLYFLQATMCFWTVQTLEVMNCVTDGGNFASRVPMTIYRPMFRQFFTYIVPLACVNYLPLYALTGKGSNLPTFVPWLAPLLGFGFLGLCMFVWTFGVGHYRSTGS